MIPAPFDYVRADSADAASRRWPSTATRPSCSPAGMSLLPLMKLRLATPTVLVDVGRLRDLSYVRDGGDHVAIGALTRHRDLETSDAARATECGVLRAVAAEVGDNQVRHRGTIGGSVAHGDPASDLPAVLLALDATFVGRGARRASATIAARRVLPRASSRPRSRPTSCSPRSGCRRPEPAGSRTRSSTGGPRTGRSSARVAVAQRQRPRVGAREHGLHAAAGRRRSRRRSASGASVADAAQHAAEGTEPPTDLNATPEYREHLARVLVRRALEAASA